MLSQHELKVVLTALTQRRAWVLKTLENKETLPEHREEHLQHLKLLESAMQKLARGHSGKPSAPPPATATPARKPLKRQIEPKDAYVLIAEDDSASVELLRNVLEDMGITKIETVANGRAALYALQNCSPAYDIVLCDWDMPEMNGLEVRKAIRALAKLKDTYYVMVTGLTDAARIREAIALGVSDYVAKPIDLASLERKIHTFLAGDEKDMEKGASSPQATPDKP